MSFRRIQVYFEKVGDASLLSHLDLVRTMDRAIRRSELPARFTEGMNPKIRMSFPTALPLGMDSRLEVMEIQVAAEVTVREVCERLGAELPPGLRPTSGEVLYTGEKRKVGQIHYVVFPAGDRLPTEEEVRELLGRDRILVERRGKERDLRRLLTELAVEADRILVSIAWTDSGTARPEDVLRALGRDPDGHRVVKVGVTFVTSHGEMIERRNGAADPHQRS